MLFRGVTIFIQSASRLVTFWIDFIGINYDRLEFVVIHTQELCGKVIKFCPFPSLPEIT